jgi:phage protein D
VGDVPTEKLKYSCQKDETDLGYLQRLASENNAVFTVKGDKLIFHDIAALDAQKTAWIIKKSDVASYTWNDKFTETGVSLSYFDGDNEETIDFNVDTGDDDGVPPGDLVKFRNVVAAWTQQNTRGKAEQKKAKSAENGMTLTLEGNIKLVAGCNIELQGFGAALGKKIMRISEATHKIDGGGYTTDLTLKSI